MERITAKYGVAHRFFDRTGTSTMPQEHCFGLVDRKECFASSIFAILKTFRFCGCGALHVHRLSGTDSAPGGQVLPSER